MDLTYNSTLQLRRLAVKDINWLDAILYHADGTTKRPERSEALRSELSNVLTPLSRMMLTKRNP